MGCREDCGGGRGWRVWAMSRDMDRRWACKGKALTQLKKEIAVCCCHRTINVRDQKTSIKTGCTDESPQSRHLGRH